MKLYIFEHCPFSTRARMIFGMKNIPVELSIVMEDDAETPIRLMGKKGVPILERDDGTSMAESMDIVRYVDARFPPKVITEPGRKAIDAWCEEARPIVSRLAIPRMTRSAFKENATEAAQQAYLARERKALGDLDALFNDTPNLLTQMKALLARLDSLVEHWTGVSESDFILYSTLRSVSITAGIQLGLETRKFCSRMAAAGGVPLLEDRAI